MAEHIKSNYFLYRSSLVASLAGFLFGFDTVVISGAEQHIQLLWNLSSSMHGLVTSIALWGTLLGAFIGGIPSEKWGRKNTLMFVGVLYFISALGSGLAPEPYSFIFFRFMGGIGIGISTIAAPLYISEISPADQRGRLTGLFQFNIVFGILMAFLSNALLFKMGDHAWRWMLGIEAIPALVFIILAKALPSSPRWVIRNKKDKAEGLNIFSKINPQLSLKEVNQMVNEVTEGMKDGKEKEAFFTKRLLKPISLAFFIAFFNQLSGINAILYFAPRIFEMTGLGSQAALLQSIGIGLFNLVFTLIGLFLIDRIGRKTLLVYGSFGYIASLGICAWAFQSGNFALVPYCIFVFIAAHAIGQGAVIWVFIGEIFSNNHRAKGQTLGSFTHWFLAALLTLVFPIGVELFKPEFIFGFFGIMMVIQLFWVIFYVPETKGKSLDDI